MSEQTSRQAGCLVDWYRYGATTTQDTTILAERKQGRALQIVVLEKILVPAGLPEILNLDSGLQIFRLRVTVSRAPGPGPPPPDTIVLTTLH